MRVETRCLSRNTFVASASRLSRGRRLCSESCTSGHSMVQMSGFGEWWLPDQMICRQPRPNDAFISGQMMVQVTSAGGAKKAERSREEGAARQSCRQAKLCPRVKGQKGTTHPIRGADDDMIEAVLNWQESIGGGVGPEGIYATRSWSVGS